MGSKNSPKFIVDDEVQHLISRVSELYQQKTPLATVQKEILAETQKIAELSLTLLEVPKSSCLSTSIRENLGQVITWCFFYGSNSQDLETRKTITAKSQSVTNVAETLNTLIKSVTQTAKRKFVVFSFIMACAVVAIMHITPNCASQSNREALFQI